VLSRDIPCTHYLYTGIAQDIVVMSSPKLTYVSLLGDESIHEKYDRALQRVKGLLGKRHHMHIGGRKIRSNRGEFEVHSPIDRNVSIGTFPKGTSSHGKLAIDEATDAFHDWRRLDYHTRVGIVRKAADLIEEELYTLSALITYEVGKNRYEALAEVSETVDMLRYYGDQLETNQGFVRTLGPGAPGEQAISVMKPLGAWFVISPFNFPLALTAGMATGALITGNTVVLKPTSAAPFTGLRLFEHFRNAGTPDGVLNYVTGPGEAFEKEVIRNPKVAGIAFTGSMPVGMRLYRKFASDQLHPKPVIAEMGSKNPAIVTAKADLVKAAEGISRGAFGYSGQKCSATARVYVISTVMDEFIDSFLPVVKKLKVGDPRLKETFVGPVVNTSALSKYQKVIDQAKTAGGKILMGGSVITKGSASRGYYVEPTIISDLPAQHELFKEELFLPIVIVDQCNSLEEALRKANDTQFGLTAGIFSEDPSEIAQFFDGIEFGVTYANRRGGATTGAWPGAQSFSGWKCSGSTGKGVGGPYYLSQFLREQTQTRVES
tara:strand:+ start:9187 stop:10827 length:1641 start_codon:yes stop_codon:yes gene_type:complete